MPFLVLLSIVALAVCILSFRMSVWAVRVWHGNKVSAWLRLFMSALAASALAFALSLGIWVPLAWRASDLNLGAFAAKCRQAGIWVEPTLVIYQNINTMSEGRSAELLADPVIQFLPQSTRSRWARIPAYRPPFKERAIAILFRRNLQLAQRVSGSLQRAAVPLMLGTDTFGFPFCIPGKSAHDEMELMRESGLTPFQVLQSATINPARFVGKDREFGTVAVGKRADLLLVQSNPLVNLETTRKPVGVMVRGVWLTSERLQKMLDGLVDSAR